MMRIKFLFISLIFITIQSFGAGKIEDREENQKEYCNRLKEYYEMKHLGKINLKSKDIKLNFLAGKLAIETKNREEINPVLVREIERIAEKI